MSLTSKTRREVKEPVRVWLRSYTDEQLAALLAHAQSGKLVYYSCCCLIGSKTADHALQGKNAVSDYRLTSHYWGARSEEGAPKAEWSFLRMGIPNFDHFLVFDEFEPDNLRRRRIIPMIKSEMWQRERRKKQSQVNQEEYATVL